MPFIRFLASERYTYIIAVILSLGKIMPSYSRCEEKKLVYIVIVVPSGRQPSFYVKCTKLNMHLSYNIKSVSNAKYIFIFLCNIHSLS